MDSGLSKELAGRAVKTWGPSLARYPLDVLARAAIEVFEKLVAPRWLAGRPHDARVPRAAKALGDWLRAPTPGATQHARVLAKGCSAARKESLGYEHRVAEAARALASIPSAQTDSDRRQLVLEALMKIEEQLRFELQVAGQYSREPEAAARVLAAVGEALPG